jgi:two-component system, NtrC family, C4-dicarboxylate transport sensor histidine kinase DctB
VKNLNNWSKPAPGTLRTAQDGLVQSAKLAALGQMSAALAHEINQPLTAQRMQLATLRLLLDHGRIDDAYKALTPLEHMLTRMAALTGHLKTYARQSPSGLRERLDLASVVDQALQLVEPRLQGRSHRTAHPAGAPGLGARRCDSPGAGHDQPAAQCPGRHARHTAQAVGNPHRSRSAVVAFDRQRQRWRDCDEHLGKVFDPFFTTKPVGDGLGLGLAVSYAIVHELGGRLTACQPRRWRTVHIDAAHRTGRLKHA